MRNEIIDTHLHLWDLGNQINDWVLASQDPTIIRNFSLSDYQELYPSVTKIITVEAANSRDSLKEVEWLARLVDLGCQGLQLRHIAYINVSQDPASFIEELKKFASFDFISGFRDIMAYSQKSHYSPSEADITLDQKRLNKVKENLRCLAEHGYLFDCQMYPEQLIRFVEVLIDSQVKCVIDHCALPLFTNARSIASWVKSLNCLKMAEVYFKISGLDMNNNHNRCNEIFEGLFENLPESKMLVGSNYPLGISAKVMERLGTFMDNNGLAKLWQQIAYDNANELFFLS